MSEAISRNFTYPQFTQNNYSEGNADSKDSDAINTYKSDGALIASKDKPFFSDRTFRTMDAGGDTGYAANSKIPPGSFLVDIHANSINGVQDQRYQASPTTTPFAKNLSPVEFASMIKKEMHGQRFNQVIVLGCTIGVNKKYMQSVTDHLGLPVWAATRFVMVSPDGKIQVRNPNNKDIRTVGSRTGKAEAGYFIEYRPNKSPNRFGVCDNQQLVDCLPKR